MGDLTPVGEILPSVRLSRTGKPLAGAAGQAPSEETKRKMAEGRRRAFAAKKRAQVTTREEAKEAALKDLEPMAIREIRRIMEDPDSSPDLRFKASVKILEYAQGKPTQKIEMEGRFEKVVYELAPHEPAPILVAAEIITLPPGD